MNLTLIANIEGHGNAGFIGWIDSIKGLVVQGSSPEEVCNELITSLKVKLAYDLGLPASELKEIDEEEAIRLQREFAMKKVNEGTHKKEIKLTLS